MTQKKENQQNQNAAAEQPIFRLQKLFIKDLSFENPNAPAVFTAKQGEPKVEVNLGIKNKKMAVADLYEVILTVNAKITHGSDNQVLFIVEVEHGGIFLLKNIPEQHLPAVLAVDCPNMMFPYTRQIISQLSVDGGYVPFLMEPVNFLALYQNTQRRAAEERKKQGQQPTQ